MTIHGDKHINKYCNTNNINDIKENVNLLKRKEFFYPGKIKPLELRDYNLRLNLKSEKSWTVQIVQSITNKLSSMGRTYRYKKIYLSVQINYSDLI